jgi:hypothetical protein
LVLSQPSGTEPRPVMGFAEPVRGR